MISDKMQAFASSSSVVRKMFEEGKKMAAQYGAAHVFDFSLGNPNVPPPKAVTDAALYVLQQESPTLVHGYTNNAGFEEVRSYVAEQTNQSFGMHYVKESVTMVSGAAAGLNIILKTILNPGDEVIAIAPFFSEYRPYVENYDGILVTANADPHTFQLSIEAIEQKLSPKTKAVILNSPNNPTGVVYPESSIKQLAALLEQYQAAIGHPIYLISDEPYRRLVYGAVTVPFAAQFYTNTFVVYSFSKTLSLPGERIGFILVNPSIDDFSDMTAALSVANRISGFVNAPSLFQRIVFHCFHEEADISYYDKNRKTAYAMLTELGFSCVKPEGAFYLFPQCLIPDDIAFCEKAKAFHLLLVPGSAYGCPGHFRMSYCVSYDTIVNAFDAFQQLARCYQ